MARDYKKEREKANERYERILADVTKNLGVKFKEKLQKDESYNSIAEWITEQIKIYLEK